MNPAKILSAALLLAASAASAHQGASPHPAISPNAALHGVWRNPPGTVEVRIEDCGPNLCGVVTNAAQEAIQDARDTGYPALIGMQLLRDYRADRPNHWAGTVLVPDMGRSFSSHIELIAENRARITGCLWHQFFCQSQIWQRI